ncbi:MAG: UDP-N-acetylmuramoyl-tripeptide--D-alanyl-D-alanine ligase [Defluviitaleaceae bacterium]|nr:UDP-N-acetylmuramoyl-tripeptide--D-alanyl-D-alanine ligase [Defluviitaleaceae bacterium]
MQLIIQEIAAACNGHLMHPDAVDLRVTSICTDTRTLAPGALFVPLKGDNFDGHNYIAQAAAAGAIVALTENETNDSPIPLIRVSSTHKALLDLAAYFRRIHNIKVVAVAGSAGKTTTKEMIAAVLAQRYKVKKTPGNFNNHIGLPLSIFQLEPDDQVLVLEMGMNHAGEITPLSHTAAPDIAVLTYIGDEHMENFANHEAVLQANLEIVDGMAPGSTVVLNGDNPLLTGPIAAQKTQPFTVHRSASANIMQAEPRGLAETVCHFRINDTDLHLTIPLPGSHMAMNALLAATVAIEMGLTPQEIANGFASMNPPEGRLSVTQANGMTLINDAYNASPASMQEAIKVLLLETPHKTQRRVCILGDMYELGNISEQRHREVGAFAEAAGIDLLVAIGPMARWLHEGYIAATERVFSALHFADVDTFLAQWQTILFARDTVLIKASNGMKFDKIVRTLSEECS